MCMHVCLRVRGCAAHPVAEDAGARVGGLDVSDERDVLQFGEDEQQQTLHPDGRQLKDTHTHTHDSTNTHWK